MSGCSSKRTPITDPLYYNYFKEAVKNDGRIYDQFVEAWKNLDLKDIDYVTHWNIYNVLQLILENRNKNITAYNKVLTLLKEKETVLKSLAAEKEQLLKQKNDQIEVLEREKSDAAKLCGKENAEKLKFICRIKELESFWFDEQAKNKNGQKEIADLKIKIKAFEEDEKLKNERMDRYRSQRNKAENELDKKLKELIAIKEQFGTFQNNINELKTRNIKVEDDLKKANIIIKELQTQLQQFNGIQNEYDRVKAELEQNEEELERAKDELKNERLKNGDESNPSQMAQIELQQLQQALTCTTDQIQKLKNELEAARNELKLKERKSSALQELLSNVKKCEATSLKISIQKPSILKGLNERITALKKENSSLVENIQEKVIMINGTNAQCKEFYIENINLKAELESLKKHRKKQDDGAEKRKRSSEQKEKQQQQKGEGSKRARNEMQQSSTMALRQQHFNNGPISCSSPTMISTVSSQNFGILQEHVFLNSMNPLNQIPAPPNMMPFQQNDRVYSSQLHQNVLQQKLILQRYPHNQLMSSINHNYNNQQQLLPPNSTPEILPPTVLQQQQMSSEQFRIYLESLHQQQLRLSQGNMVPPPLQQHQLQPSSSSSSNHQQRHTSDE